MYVYMDSNYVCPVCQRCFTQLGNMKRHMSHVHSPEKDILKSKRKFVCTICQKSFTRNDHLKRHAETIHNKTAEPNVNDNSYQKLVSKISELESELKQRDDRLKSEINEVKNKSTINQQQILNVICVSNTDNYLDMLTERLGDFDRAIDYIKDCALSDLVGDCKLLEKIYGNPNDVHSFTIDQKKTKITYINERNESVTEHKDTFGRKLANNLQNSYLKGINYLIHRNLDSKIDPNKFLENYDILTWNNHIYCLSDSHQQRDLINQLRISIK